MIKQLIRKVGIDWAIGYAVLARVIQAGGGLITLALIAIFLTKEEQGYYYTFGSILAVQIFFELGLTGIITQYVAHETVHLQWASATELSGNTTNLSRLSSLLHFCIKVFSSLAFLLFIVLAISGYLFFTKFNQSTTDVHWLLPWLLLSFSASLLLVISPLLAFIEGLGKVKEVAKLRFIQQSLSIATVALVFFFKGGLFASGVASFVSFLILLTGISVTNQRKLLLFVYNSLAESTINYWKEIFPFQWKIAVSWISGYLVFQLFNPAIFATEGAIEAGRMGMTLQALNGISSLSMSWMTTKIPLMSSLIAATDYKKLDTTFNKTIVQLSSVNIFLILIFVAGVAVLNYFNLPFGQRFLSIYPLLLLCISTFANQFIFSWATYLRCHKQEPFLLNSIVCGILSALSIMFLSKYFGLMGIVTGFTCITLFISLPWGYSIFINKKKAWHNE